MKRRWNSASICKKPEFTEQEIIDLTKDGVTLGCATICINPGYMELCRPYVEGSSTKLCPVCDFPFGTSSTASKVAQAKIILDSYADVIGELDIVANFGLIRSGKYDEVTKDIKAVAETCHAEGIPVKVIFETLQLIDMGIDRMGISYRSVPVVLGLKRSGGVL